MDKKTLFIEFALLAFAGYWWFFVATNVNPLLGDVYKGLTLLAIVVLIGEYEWGKVSVPLRSQTNNWLTISVAVLVAYLGLVFGGQFIVQYAQKIPITQLLQYLAATTAPVFSNSAQINAITFIFMVSFIETQGIFVRGFDLIITVFNRMFGTNLEINKENLFKPTMWIIIFFISLGFLILHSQAKGIELSSSAALLLVFLMGVISCMLVCWFREARPAIFFHIVANFAGYYLAFGVANFSIFNLIGG